MGILESPTTREIPETQEIPEPWKIPGNSHTENSWEEKFEAIRVGGSGTLLLNIPGVLVQVPMQGSHLTSPPPWSTLQD